MDDVVDLVGLAKPLPKVRFPNGTEHQAVPFDAIAYRLRSNAEKLTDPQERSSRGLELLRRSYPSATDADFTDADFASLGIEDVETILKICTRQIDLAYAVGNGSGAVRTTPASDFPDSSPPTMSSTSASESGESPAAASSTA
jgi:hypothetical protein